MFREPFTVGLLITNMKLLFRCLLCMHLCMGFVVLLCLLLSYLLFSNINMAFQKDLPKCIAPNRTHDDILILMWSWPFGGNYVIRCSEFDMVGCRLTDDRSAFCDADAILFHHRDIGRGLWYNMPPIQRPWFQKWIWFNWESPDNSALIPPLNDLFNLTSSYRLDSDIPVPYGYLTPVGHQRKNETFKLPHKDKLVCWVVSNWNRRFKRVQIYEEMKRHIKIDVYGRAFNRILSHDDYLQLMPSCKFYLSWENSIHRDYLSDKLYDPMKMGTVPVVLGPSRRNYESHVPGDSFIHVDDFASPKELAERLIYLDNNHMEYMQYFKWRETHKVHQCIFVSDHVCRACQHLKMHKGYQVFHDLNKWYWGLKK